MKKIFVLFISMIAALTLDAQIFVGSFNDVRLIKDKPVFTGSLFVQNTTKKIGFSAFALTSQGWGEILIGPTISVNKNLNIYFQVGIETVKPHYRLALSTFYLDDVSRFFGSVEKGDGRKNYWYTAMYDWQPKKLTLGGMIQRGYGVGPRIGHKFGKLWPIASVLYDYEVNTWRPTLFVNYFLGAGLYPAFLYGKLSGNYYSSMRGYQVL